jgi:hypothetical protein
LDINIIDQACPSFNGKFGKVARLLATHLARNGRYFTSQYAILCTEKRKTPSPRKKKLNWTYFIFADYINTTYLKGE